jgi:patatin-like phospholipase
MSDSSRRPNSFLSSSKGALLLLFVFLALGSCTTVQMGVSHSVVVLTGDGGHASEEGIVGVRHGATAVIEFMPDDGYIVQDTILDGVSLGSVQRVSLAKVSESHEIRAIFVQERTCLVLSVGAAKGLAHLGAIEALEELGIRVDAIFGTSAGSLVGAVYAYDPSKVLSEVGNELFGQYTSVTKAEAVADGFSAGILTGLL